MRRKVGFRRSVLSILTVVAIIVPGLADADHGTTTLVSRSFAEGPGDGASTEPVVTPDGRFVVFSSYAADLVSGDTNGVSDVFLLDRDGGSTERVSLSWQGEEAAPGGRLLDQGAFRPAISDDGRFVSFSSMSTNLVDADSSDHTFDIYLRDRSLDTTEKISWPVEGAGADGDSYYSSLSADGRLVAFDSVATDIVEGDSNDASDVFVQDRMTRVTSRVSVASSGEQARSDSELADVSADGRFVLFTSDADNLVQYDDNGFTDVFVRDLQMGTTSVVSQTGDNQGISGMSFAPRNAMSDDGRYVVFLSFASRVAPGRTQDFITNVYLRDRDTDENGLFDEPGSSTTYLVSQAPSGEAMNGSTSSASISADGRWIVFDSEASNMTDEDLNLAFDVFLFDRASAELALISVSSANQRAWGGPSIAGTVSADGSVVFSSSAMTLVEGDDNRTFDVFVRDLTPALPTCASGRFEEGRVSGLVHERVEPAAPAGAEQMHDANCGLIVEAGL